MNEIHKSKLETIAGDDYSLQALQIVFDENVNKFLPKVEDNDNNNTIGQKYRAHIEAKQILAEVMKDIKSHKVDITNLKSFNKAR